MPTSRSSFPSRQSLTMPDMGIDKNAVFLLTSADGGKKAFGTGFAVACKEGQLYLLTCAHVADQLDGRINAGGEEAEIVVRGSADGIDLALLRIPCEQAPPLLNSIVSGKQDKKFQICGYGPFAGAKDNYVLRDIEGRLGKAIAFESAGGERVEAWDLHVEDDDFSRLQGGYSGSPLCDETGGLVAVVSHKIGNHGQRGHAVALANLQTIYPDIEQLIPSFSGSDNRIQTVRRGALYHHLLDSTTKRISFGLLAVVLLLGLIISVKYLRPDSKTSETNKLTETQKQKIPIKHLDPPGNLETEIKTGSTPESKIVFKPVQPAESEQQVSPPAHLVSKIEAQDTMTDPITGMEFVSVPGGCFQMGSPDNEKERSNNEGPRHKVCVDGFRMGKYEVTQGQWVKIMGSNPSQYQKGDEYPVEKVSWNKIQEFITKLNKQSGREYRLPTEWEWEYAARAGTSTARYWGDDISCDRAMYGNDKYQEQVSCMDYIRSEEALTPYSSAPVGSYPPNRFGLYDMLGNVSEFCSNWLGDYPSAQLNNPQGPAKGNIRVFRGGALGSSESGIRSAFRWGLPLHERNYGIGFRLVLPGL